ncbi:MAG: 23S rRNA (uracil(1939)-C(5))-methyltransferase RlmD, partial [Desulfobacterales bacterium]|nr:23S rRNA (uracil(1939)-C(5))-methyltransferase RlmD [Desulfobacterales bacterium]
DLVFGYRNKMEFSCSDRRWLLPEELGNQNVDKGFALGLHVPGTYDKIIDINKCLLQPELGNNILKVIKEYIRNSIEPVYGLRSHIGFWRYVVLRNSVSYDEWMINLVTAKENKNEVQPLADKLTEKYPQVVSIVNNITSKKAGVAVGEYEILLHGRPFIKDKIGNIDFEISANSFFQTNTKGAEKLYAKILECCQLSGNEVVLDLYCGTGSIAIYLSSYVKEVIGIEIVESAIANAKINCQNNNVSNCRFILGDIQKCLLDIRKNPDVLIVDPPRSGMHKDVVRQVVEMGAERIVYVSCNPSTLARDIALMKEKYNVMEVQPVDMFPHTYHIEAVCRLEKKTASL